MNVGSIFKSKDSLWSSPITKAFDIPYQKQIRKIEDSSFKSTVKT